MPADLGFLFGDDLPKTIMIVTANKKICRTSKTSSQSYNSLLKFQKTCVYSLKTQGIATKIGIKIEVLNIRNNTAAITVTNIPNKRNIKIGRPISHNNTLTQQDVKKDLKTGINTLRINISWIY